MPPSSSSKKKSIAIRLLKYLVLNGDSYQMDLYKKIDCSSDSIKRVSIQLRENGFIKITYEESTEVKGQKRYYLGVTLPGLIIAFAYDPTLWDHLFKISSNYETKKLLPLIFDKFQLFAGIEIESGLTLDQYLLIRLRMAFDRIADPLWQGALMKYERNRNRQAVISRIAKETDSKFGYSEVTRDLVKDAIEAVNQLSMEVMTKRRIDNEIYLYVYFDWDSGVNPFTTYPYIGIDSAKKIWESPTGSPSDVTPLFTPKILSTIMIKAQQDPELRAFFSKTIKTREVYTEATTQSTKSLTQLWKKSMN